MPTFSKPLFFPLYYAQFKNIIFSSYMQKSFWFLTTEQLFCNRYWIYIPYRDLKKNKKKTVSF